MELRHLPAINATLNFTAFVLLLIGYRLIRAGKRETHRKVMLAAFTVSALFLTSYLIYHFNVGSGKFQQYGPIRTVSYAILISNIGLAMVVPAPQRTTHVHGRRERGWRRA